MCVILSHGVEKKRVYAKDKLFDPRKTIIDPIIENRTLNGVVKIFIVNACRGSGTFKTKDYSSEMDGCILSTSDDVDYSNVLKCYSTVEGKLILCNSQSQFNIAFALYKVNSCATSAEKSQILIIF